MGGKKDLGFRHVLCSVAWLVVNHAAAFFVLSKQNPTTYLSKEHRDAPLACPHLIFHIRGAHRAICPWPVSQS